MATADADDDATLDTLDGTHRRTLLYDAMGYVGDQIAEIREEIAREMRNTPATAEMPGTAAMVPVTLARKIFCNHGPRGNSLRRLLDAATFKGAGTSCGRSWDVLTGDS
jgi:diadenosine tetraphosphatase ApaH/serine/threonine PP2A family protein phosphatase